MPTLNRIRIANVSYDHKYIVDELYDTYGGANTLLNLANGSGKSVLVQMMLQPILPCKSIHGRKLESYLTRGGAPTYLMLEWKLDRTARPAYFLTGIVMGFSRPNENDDVAQVKYFTFTHQYQEGNALDIRQIPLVFHNAGEHGKGVVYRPYEDARQFVQEQERSHLEFRSFAKDKKKNYYDALREHGIFPEEWELLAKINEKEGGVDELFSNCKTSDVLLDRWILNVVSDGLASGRGELLEMFEALISSILEQEKALQDKERTELFLEQLDPVQQQIKSLCSNLEQKERIEHRLSGLHRHLQQTLDRLQQEQAHLEEELSQIRAEERHIEGEKLSKQYYDRQEDCALLDGQLETQRLLLDEQAHAYLQAKRELEACEAAEYYEKLVRAEQSVFSLEDRIRILREGKEQEDFCNVVFTLAGKYDEQAEAHAGHKAEAQALLQEARANLDAWKAEREQLQKRDGELNAQRAILHERLKRFREKEQEVFQRLALALNRNMLGELDRRESEAAGRALEERAASLAQLQADLRQKIQETQKRAQELREEQAQCVQKRVELSGQISRARQKVTDWKTAAEALRRRLEQYRPACDLYDKGENTAFLQHQRELWQVEENTALRQRDRLHDLLENCRRGSLHTAPTFRQALEAAGIQVITGEAYLKQSTADEQRQKELLEKNPLLPYCFLVARGDLSRAQQAAMQEPIDRVCPVMAVDDVEEALAAEGRTVFPEASIRLVCRYNWESLGAKSCATYEERLSKQLAQAQQSCEALHSRLLTLEQDLKEVVRFPYGREDGPALEQALAQLEEEQSGLEAKSRALQGQEEQQRRIEKDIKNEADRCVDELREAQERKNAFALYLEDNARYESDLQKTAAIQKELEQVAQRTTALKRSYEETDCNSRDLEQQIREQARMEQELRRKRGALTVPAAGALLPLDIPALEDRYQALSNRLNQDERTLNHQKNLAVQSGTDAKLTLARRFSHIPREAYKDLPFDEDELERRQQRADRLQGEWDDAKLACTRKETETKNANGRLKDAKDRLKEAGWEAPLPQCEIKGNDAARLTECAQKRTLLNQQIKENRREQGRCETRRNSILRIIDPSFYSPEEHPPEGGYEAMDLSALGQAHEELKNKAADGLTSFTRKAMDLEKMFRGTAPTIDNVLDGIRLEKGAPTFNSCYFLYERLEFLLKRLNDYLDILRSSLQRVEAQKENVVRQAAEQGRGLHRELCRINSNAAVRISKGRAPQSILQIGVPESLDGQSEERMRNYVSQCISTAREMLSKGELTKEKMRRYLEDRFSDRQILNTVIGRTDIRIKLYKVESIAQNSRLKAWENIVVENSGGELFVSCFILISALMGYARRRKLAQQNAAEGSKVFLIDNPFGKASSPHLLEAMIEVARKFDTQLICLSDLSQSSITQQFDLIYQLSMRQTAYSNNSYLKTDEVKNNAERNMDGRLEHVSAHWEQMSLL